VEHACEDVDAVFHLAALGSVPRSIKDPRTTTEVNVQGTVNVLQAAVTCGVPRVVIASSSSVYGDTTSLPMVETQPAKPMSPYAASKLACEQYAQAFSSVYPISVVALRYFNVFGPRQDPAGPYAAVIPRFIGKMLAGERPEIYGSEGISRDFTYVDNVVDATIRALEAELSGCLVANVACGRMVTLGQLAGTIGELLGSELEPIVAAPRPGDIRCSVADVSQAGDKLGYAPGVLFREGLRETILWHQCNWIVAN